MPLYVFALLDRAPGHGGRGLGGPLAIRRVNGGFAAVERRADVPPLEFNALQAHQRIVDRLAATVPAILPVRFGTLLSAAELDSALDEREEDVKEAFDRVRGRVQFTWRGSNAAAASGHRATGRRPRSGVEYLQRAARVAHPSPPASFRRAAALRTLAVDDRFVAATTLVPAALYHLVDRRRADAYASAAAAVRAHAPALTWSGPFAPYAFAPELL